MGVEYGLVYEIVKYWYARALFGQSKFKRRHCSEKK